MECQTHRLQNTNDIRIEILEKVAVKVELPISIRVAGAKDAGVLSELAVKGFRETFLHYEAEALDRFLAEHYSAEKFFKELEEPENIFWIVEDGDDAIAYAQVGPYKLSYVHSFERVVELYRLYVLSAYQGRAIGTRLMQLVFHVAHQSKAQAIFLGVWEHNVKAQNIYLRYGFEKVGGYEYPPIGEIVDHEWIMCKKL